MTVDVETLDVRAETASLHCGSTRIAGRSRNGDHSVEFDVDQHGLVLDYPGRFRRLS